MTSTPPPDPYGQPSAGQPSAGQPPAGPPPGPPGGGYGYSPPPRGTNTMAILALVFAFVFSPLGIVFGHLSKKQIRQTGEQGEGLATAGLVLGYIFTGLYLLGCCIWLVVVIGLFGASTTT